MCPDARPSTYDRPHICLVPHKDADGRVVVCQEAFKSCSTHSRHRATHGVDYERVKDKLKRYRVFERYEQYILPPLIHSIYSRGEHAPLPSISSFWTPSPHLSSSAFPSSHPSVASGTPSGPMGTPNVKREPLDPRSLFLNPVSHGVPAMREPTAGAHVLAPPGTDPQTSIALPYPHQSQYGFPPHADRGLSDFNFLLPNL